MAALSSADVTVAIGTHDRELAGGGAFKNLTLAAITFGNGSLTYPANGVPLPVIGTFGFRQAIDAVFVNGDPDQGFIYKYDKTHHSIRIYTQGFVTGTTSVGAAENGALVKNSAGAEATGPRMPKTGTSTTYDMGPLIELPTSVAPAATTLSLLMIGS